MKLRFLTSSFAFRPAALATALLACGCSSPSTGATATRPHVSTPVPALASAPVTVLAGSLHPAARPERDLGRMDPAVTLTNLSLLFERSPAQKKRLASDLVTIQDPTSPAYHRWLSPTEFGDRYGAAPVDVARVRAWLVAQGFSVDGVPATASRISFSGTIGQIERAFKTEMHRYQVNGQRHFALSRAPSVPESLGTVVAALHGAHDFRIPPPPGTRRPHATFEGALALAPSDFTTIYDVDALYAANITGKGQTLAIVGESDYNQADILAFRTAFGFDTTNLPTDILVPNTGSSEVLDPGDVSETTLDLEWSGAVAKDAQLMFVYTGDSTNNYGFFDSLVYAVETRVAPIVSVSYGSCEKGLTPSDAVYYGQVGDLAAMVGVTVTVASGDTGAAGCDGEQESAATQGLFVGFPASIPTVVAVGGTQFSFTGATQSTYWSPSSAALEYIPEVAWNQTFASHSDGLGAGGGGYSVMFPRPYWQAAALPHATFRGLPDVALTASSYTVPYIISDSWTAADGDGQTPFPEELDAIGGTSASTPSFAGILALLNQSINAPTPGLGNIGPVLYALYTSAPSAFHDITGGSNMVPCQSGTEDCPAGTTEYGYDATVGYDLATGLGSVDAFNFVNAWTALAPTSTTLAVQGSGGAEGSNLTLTATIGSNATAHAMTGTVTFYFDTFDTSMQPDVGYSLGTATVVADVADGGTSGATATITAPTPVGLTGTANIVAAYGGDKNYLGSYSAGAAVSATSTFAVTPPTIMLQPNQQTTFTTTGGVPPVTWRILSDQTCNFSQENCAEEKTLTPTSAGFQAGPGTGQVTLEALDSDYAEVRVTITVAGNPVDGGNLITVDAGVDASSLDADFDAGVDASSGFDAPVPPSDAHALITDTGVKRDVASSSSSASTTGSEDSGAPEDDASKKSDASESTGSSGGCAVAPRETPDLGLVGAMLLGLLPFASRRRQRA